MAKYVLTSESMKLNNGTTVYRIMRESNGQLGGWVQSTANLSQSGTCWIADNAIAEGNSLVSGSAQLLGNAWITQNAQVFDSAVIYGRVAENSWVYGLGIVRAKGRVAGTSRVHTLGIILDTECLWNVTRIV